ncbi:MAG TPA: exosortase F system-associated protein [Cytophagales bacterium]|nr:exosortase F system-associated protein [Cytophagales bacterium]
MESGKRRVKISWVVFSIASLALVYIFQRFNYAEMVYSITSIDLARQPNGVFAINRTIRLLINDTLCMILIYALFQKRSYLKLSGIIFGFEVLVLLPLYLWAKLSMEGPSEISSPLLSPIHRMIVNPLLMIVLIAALYYQQYILAKAK